MHPDREITLGHLGKFIFRSEISTIQYAKVPFKEAKPLLDSLKIERPV
jgi:hypothetical protein